MQQRFHMNNLEFCPDEELGFVRSRTPFDTSAGLVLDPAYRLAHLPLVAADHPRVIVARDGSPYRMGRHPAVHSLVLPIPADTLFASPGFQAIDRALRASVVTRKIAWDLMERRRHRLHATLCGSLGRGDAVPVLSEAQRRSLAALGPVGVRVRGLFSGNVNVGRLYLACYPERRDGANMFHEIQRALGRTETDLYVIGVYNLTDDLDAAEAQALAGIIEATRDHLILELEAEELWLLSARDDLALDSDVAAVIPLVPR